MVRYDRLDVIEQLKKELSVSEKGRQSGVIALSLQGTDRQKIAHILKAGGINYVRQNIERKSAEAEKSLAFLGDFLPQLKKQLEDSELRFNQFRNQNGTFDLGIEGKNYLEVAVKLQAMHRSVTKQIEYWAQLGKAAEDNPDLPVGMIREILISRQEAAAGMLSDYKFD